VAAFRDPGEHLLAVYYAVLPEAQGRRLADDLGTFLAQLHTIAAPTAR
jgi:aminoglycoside phosphotransferase (APT) family kinase protein